MKAFKAIKKLFEAPQRSVKIKIEGNFFSLSGIEAVRLIQENDLNFLPINGIQKVEGKMMNSKENYCFN